MTRELDGQERQAIFNSALPDFACGAEKHFGAVYTKLITWFIQSVEKLGKRFLDSEVGKD